MHNPSIERAQRKGMKWYFSNEHNVTRSRLAKVLVMRISDFGTDKDISDHLLGDCFKTVVRLFGSKCKQKASRFCNYTL